MNDPIVSMIPDPLLGLFFYSSSVGGQCTSTGQILAAIGQGLYLVQVSVDGVTPFKAIVPACDMGTWRFYDSEETATVRKLRDISYEMAGMEQPPELNPTGSTAIQSEIARRMTHYKGRFEEVHLALQGLMNMIVRDESGSSRPSVQCDVEWWDAKYRAQVALRLDLGIMRPIPGVIPTITPLDDMPVTEVNRIWQAQLKGAEKRATEYANAYDKLSDFIIQMYEKRQTIAPGTAPGLYHLIGEAYVTLGDIGTETPKHSPRDVAVGAISTLLAHSELLTDDQVDKLKQARGLLESV
jgi:hypothetical protein